MMVNGRQQRQSTTVNNNNENATASGLFSLKKKTRTIIWLAISCSCILRFVVIICTLGSNNNNNHHWDNGISTIVADARQLEEQMFLPRNESPKYYDDDQNDVKRPNSMIREQQTTQSLVARDYSKVSIATSSIEKTKKKKKKNRRQQHTSAAAAAPPPPKTSSSPWRNDTRLEFIHIPKTGGTAIEAAASKVGILWGSCHYIAWKKEGGCNAPDLAFTEPTIVLNSIPFQDVPWHTPPHWIYPSPLDKPHVEASFAVVRHPYELYISEYYWRMGMKQKTKKSKSSKKSKNNNEKSSSSQQDDEKEGGNDNDNDNVDHVDDMNRWIRKYLRRIDKFEPGMHALPQYYYIYDDSTDYKTYDSENNGDEQQQRQQQRQRQKPKQVVTHVLRYENLHQEFAALMKQYNLEQIHLPPKKKDESSSIRSKQRRLTRADLTPETKRLIHKVAEIDFAYFQFEMDPI